MILHQTEHTKLIQLENGMQVSFFYNEWGNLFTASIMHQGIPHIHVIKDPVSKKAGFALLKRAGEEDAKKVVEEIMKWDCMKPFTIDEVIIEQGCI
jgi:hypothetical protein